MPLVYRIVASGATTLGTTFCTLSEIIRTVAFCFETTGLGNNAIEKLIHEIA